MVLLNVAIVLVLCGKCCCSLGLRPWSVAVSVARTKFRISSCGWTTRGTSNPYHRCKDGSLTVGQHGLEEFEKVFLCCFKVQGLLGYIANARVEQIVTGHVLVRFVSYPFLDHGLWSDA
eukprot:103801-Amphidinium_carterae.1